MTDRLGPQAVVTLTCEGCSAYRERHGNYSDYCVAADRHCSGGPRSRPPSVARPHTACPALPGALVAVPVDQLEPGALFPDTMMPRIETHGYTAALKLSLIDAAKALGQEFPE
ncbi:MAG: hypothetical protein J0H82_05885 [Alphaproteobacteria bacterium]|nr:hypothetical protein [Alphaproteobacteria bacterium]